jgi:cyclic pyranopterin phosphate synthase
MLEFCNREGHVLRFIEHMPIGVDDAWRPGTFLPVARVKERLSEHWVFEPDARVEGGGPAENWRATPRTGGQTSVVGFIAALTQNFCARCNRVRVTPDGVLRECLSREGTESLRDAMRNGATDEELQRMIRAALYGKVDGHYYGAEAGHRRTFRSMSTIGG